MYPPCVPLQDNAPYNTSKTAQEWTEKCDRELSVSHWPLKSPDPNQIKNVLDILKQVHIIEAPQWIGGVLLLLLGVFGLQVSRQNIQFTCQCYLSDQC